MFPPLEYYFSQKQLYDVFVTPSYIGRFHIVFVFDKQYLQINGTAMRKKWHQHTPIFLCITLKNHLICNQLRTSDISMTIF